MYSLAMVIFDLFPPKPIPAPSRCIDVVVVGNVIKV